MAAARPVRRPGAEVLSPRALNRAVLERQLLLRRADLPVAAAVEQVLGLNAQSPNPPYLALWSRVESFALKDLTTAIEEGSLVRSTMMRATQHLLSVPDFRLVRPALAPLLRRVQRNAFGRRTAGVDLDALAAEAWELLAGGRVLTRPELGRMLATTRPGADPTALGWTAQYLLPLVHPARPAAPGTPAARRRSPAPTGPVSGRRPRPRTPARWSGATWRRSGRRPWPTPAPGQA